MGEIDFNFKPSVPVFDANIALGRRNDRRVAVDTGEGTVEAMSRAGVDRAVTYSPHAINYDANDGNDWMMELIDGHEGFYPQFVGNPTWDDLDSFAARVGERGVRSIRLVPTFHKYPFRDWVVKPWLDWGGGGENPHLATGPPHVDRSNSHPGPGGGPRHHRGASRRQIRPQ